jgi:hypothetical protein
MLLSRHQNAGQSHDMCWSSIFSFLFLFSVKIIVKKSKEVKTGCLVTETSKENRFVNED